MDQANSFTKDQNKKEFKKTKFSRYIRVDFKTLQGRITIGFLLIGLFAVIMLLSSHFIWRSQVEKSKALIYFNKNSATKVAEIQQMVDLTTILAFRYISTKDNFFTGDIENRWNNDIMPKMDDLDSLSNQLDNKEINVFVTKLNEHLPKIRRQQSAAINEESYEALNSEEVIADIIHLTYLTSSIKEKLNKIEQATMDSIKEAESNITYILLIEFIMSLIVSTFIALYIIRSVLLRIKFLKVKIREMSEGSLPDELEQSEDELNSIIRALNELIYNLRGITLFAEEVGKGQFNSDISVFNNQGHLGESLAEMRTKLQTVAEQDKQRVWFNEGIAKFGDILRKNNDSIEGLSATLIAELVNYTKGNQGSLFVTEAEDNQDVKLVLKGAYAYERQKFIEKELAPGQGLVGQAYLEKEYILLSEIPQNYITIRSGLGEAVPNYILICPMKINDEVYGIIELASFSPFKEHHIEFVEKVGESIASTIQGLKVSLETKFLLEESQIKAEQLQAQEEEMRQNAEELEATQEEMERQNRESMELNKAVNESVLLLEMDSKGIITKANEKIAHLFEYDKEELLGKSHRILVPNEELVLGQIQEMNAKISQGETFSGDIKRISKSGKEHLLRVQVTPLIDNNYELKKITLFGMNISDLS